MRQSWNDFSCRLSVEFVLGQPHNKNGLMAEPKTRPTIDETTTPNEWKAATYHIDIISHRLAITDLPAERINQHLNLDKYATPEYQDFIPFKELLQLWHRAIELSGDPLLTIKSGAYAQLPYFDMLFPLFIHATTVEEGIKSFLHYQYLNNTGIVATLHYEGDSVHCIFDAIDPLVTLDEQWAAPLVEMLIAALINLGNYVLGSSMLAQSEEMLRVQFKHCPEADMALYKEQLPVQFETGCQHNKIIFPKMYMDFPLTMANIDIEKYLIQKTARQLRQADLSHDQIFKHQVLVYLSMMIPSQEPKMVECSEHFMLSTSSFKRHLKRSGTSYQKLVDTIYRQRIESLLREPLYSFSEIAEKMYFSSTSNLTRFFKRIAGVTPAYYRKHCIDKTA